MKENVFYRINNQLNEQDFIQSAKFIKKRNRGILYLSPTSAKVITAILGVTILLFVAAIEFLNPDYLFVCIACLFLFDVLGVIIIKCTNSYTYGHYLYKFNAKQEEETPINAEIIFTDKKMYTKGKKTKASFEYNQIINVFNCDDRYYIQLYNNSYLIIKKDCIVFGDKELLPEFIDKIKDKVNTPDI